MEMIWTYGRLREFLTLLLRQLPHIDIGTKLANEAKQLHLQYRMNVTVQLDPLPQNTHITNNRYGFKTILCTLFTK